MKLPKLKRGDSIRVEWWDAMTPRESNWMGPEERVDFRDGIEPNVNTGIYLGSDKLYLYICLCLDAEMEYCVGFMLIPIGCIKTARKL